MRTLKNLLRPKGSKFPMVLLGYKERDVAERSLWDMVGDIGISLEKIGERAGAGVHPVEIWAARSYGATVESETSGHQVW